MKYEPICTFTARPPSTCQSVYKIIQKVLEQISLMTIFCHKQVCHKLLNISRADLIKLQFTNKIENEDITTTKTDIFASKTFPSRFC